MAPPSEEDIRQTVLDILQDADLEHTTEFKVRKQASEKLGADLNSSSNKKLVRRIVEDYLSSKAQEDAEPQQEEGDDQQAADDNRAESGKPQEEAEEEEEEEEDAKPSSRVVKQKKAAPPSRRPSGGDGDDDHLVCQLSSKRNVSIQKFRGKTLVSIREYYEKDGELRPTAKGISLSVDQWKVLKSNVSAIEKAISKLQ